MTVEHIRLLVEEATCKSFLQARDEGKHQSRGSSNRKRSCWQRPGRGLSVQGLDANDEPRHHRHMRTATVADAKARLSALVSAAEHDGQSILILRRGRPAAVIVPVAVAAIAASATPEDKLSQGELDDFWSRFGDAKDEGSAVQELTDARRRLEPR